MRKNLVLGGLLLSVFGLVSCAPTVTTASSNPYAAALAAGGTPPAPEVKAGQLTLKRTQCNITEGCKFSENGEASGGDIMQMCMVAHNGYEKSVEGFKGGVGLPSFAVPINIYGPNASQGTWFHYKGKDTYMPHQEEFVFPGAIEAGENFFVCQAFKVK